MTDTAALAATIGRHLLASGQRLAVAESLTGGHLSSTFAAAPEASEWFLGGVVAYGREAKRRALGVGDGPVVSETAACAMARGVAELLGADVALAITGVGGPGSQDGQPPGTVWLAVCDGHQTPATCLQLDGDDPEQLLDAAVRCAVHELAGWLGLREA